MGIEDDWSLFRDGKGASFACWIATQTATRSGPRRFLLVTVTKYPRKPAEVSIFSKEKSRQVGRVVLSIDGQDFPFTTQGSTAWAKKADDAKIIKAFEAADGKGRGHAEIKWGSEVGIKLGADGFKAAYRRNITGCPTNR